MRRGAQMKLLLTQRAPRAASREKIALLDCAGEGAQMKLLQTQRAPRAASRRKESSQPDCTITCIYVSHKKSVNDAYT